jgi:hypothetical protein
VVEGTPLLRVQAGNRLEGSNPFHSARHVSALVDASGLCRGLCSTRCVEGEVRDVGRRTWNYLPTTKPTLSSVSPTLRSIPRSVAPVAECQRTPRCRRVGPFREPPVVRKPASFLASCMKGGTNGIQRFDRSLRRTTRIVAPKQKEAALRCSSREWQLGVCSKGMRHLIRPSVKGRPLANTGNPGAKSIAETAPYGLR